MKKARFMVQSLLLILGIMLFHGRICHAASVSVSTYDDLKKYLKSTSDYTIAITNNIAVTGEIDVYGNKTLIGNGKCLSRGASFKDGRLLDLAAGAHVEISNLSISGKQVSSSSNLIRVQAKASLMLQRDVEIYNAVSSIGGAAVLNAGTLITAARFDHNTANGKAGGAIRNNAGGWLTISNGEFTNNKALSGGAVFLEENSTCYLDGGSMSNNACDVKGEAIYATNVIVDGAPEIDSNNDIYVAVENGLVIRKCTSKKKLPVYFYTDKVGTRVMSKGGHFLNNLCWSHNFQNPNKHSIVSYLDDAYIGRDIVITFHTEKDEQCSVKSKTIKWGQAYGTLPTPTRTGYGFVGWDVGKNVRPHITSDTIVKVDSNITLYAEWSPKVIELNFNVNGGNALNTVWNATYDQPIWGLPKATRTGYEFLGWFNLPTGTIQYKDGDISKFSTKTTLYAHWKPKEVNVKLDPMGGSVKKNQIILRYDQAFGSIETPVRAGYDFCGWSLTKEAAGVIKTTTKVTKVDAFCLYAIWKPLQYPVTFNCYGGSVTASSIIVTYGNGYGTLPEAVREGYTFDGWYSDSAFHNRITATSIVKGTKSHQLYAKWKEKKYTVQFEANGGSVSVKQKDVTYGSAVGSLPVPKRNGYAFKGWFTKKEAGTEYRAATIFREGKSVTLYARWEVAKVTSLRVAGIKKAYMVSEEILTKDLTVSAVYNDGRVVKLSGGYRLSYQYKKAGKQTITIAYNGITYKTSAYWYDKKMMEQAIKTKGTVTLYAGNKSKIKISNAMKLNQYVTFKSANKKIATVSKSGVITAKKVGTTKLNVIYTVNGKKTTFSITVKVKRPELTVSWKYKKGSLYFAAKTKGCDRVIWKSSNKKVGTINSKTGKFTYKGQGTTYISATAGGIKRVVKIVATNGMVECYLIS